MSDDDVTVVERLEDLIVFADDLLWEERRALMVARDALAGSINVALLVDALRERERMGKPVTLEWLAHVRRQMEPFADSQRFLDSDVVAAVAQWRRERSARENGAV